jgi:inosine-uridine nucleoside N-ribohydrolase
MGGSVYTEGNVLSAQEFNIYQDPEAARVVMQSGCEIYLNTLDISMKALFTPEDRERIRALGGKVPTLVAELLDFFSATDIAYHGHRVDVAWDKRKGLKVTLDGEAEYFCEAGEDVRVEIELDAAQDAGNITE